MKRIGLVIGGFCSIGCALGFAVLLLAYLTGNAGYRVSTVPLALWTEPLSSASVLMGLAHVVGLATASFLCFSVGAVFCAHGIVPDVPVDGPNPADTKPAARVS